MERMQLLFFRLPVFAMLAFVGWARWEGAEVVEIRHECIRGQICRHYSRIACFFLDARDQPKGEVFFVHDCEKKWRKLTAGSRYSVGIARYVFASSC